MSSTGPVWRRSRPRRLAGSLKARTWRFRAASAALRPSSPREKYDPPTPPRQRAPSNTTMSTGLPRKRASLGFESDFGEIRERAVVQLAGRDSQARARRLHGIAELSRTFRRGNEPRDGRCRSAMGEDEPPKSWKP